MQLRRIQSPFKPLRGSFLRRKINGFQLLTSLAKRSIPDVLQGSEYACSQLTININKPVYLMTGKPLKQINEQDQMTYLQR